MTDGILMHELVKDPKLSKYSVIVLDEAHVATANVSFLLPFLKHICQERPSDFKLIVSRQVCEYKKSIILVLSATIDVARFSRYFSTPGALIPSETEPAPIIQIAGEGHSVAVHYSLGKVPADGVLDFALHTASSEIIDKGREGHILIFLAGQVGDFDRNLFPDLRQ